MNTIKIYHFHNGSGGGVLSVIKNLLQYSSNPAVENHVIHTINKDIIKEYSSESVKGAVTENIFYYSASWNFYYTCRQLSKLIPDENAVIVSHDWLELGMVSQLGLKNKVITFLHGDYGYYYQLAKLHQSAIDSFITIANSIAVKLRELLPEREKDINYLRFPVSSCAYFKKTEQQNNIVFIGRLTSEKGYLILPLVENLLKKRKIHVNWHIVGKGNNSDNIEQCWDDNSSVKVYGEMNNEDVLSLLRNMDFFILPSIAEGMPVSLVEAMKAGIIPLVNNIDGGIQELVNDNITGFKIINNDPVAYVDCIEKLIQNINLSDKIRSKCVEVANMLFNPWQNTKLVEAEICKTYLAPLRNKKPNRVYGSRLDQKWLPNLLTKSARSFRLAK